MVIRGMVVRGKGEGTKLGYPTANLEYAAEEHPEPGVWAARAFVEGRVSRAAAVVGMWRLPSGMPSVEVHLFDRPGDLYSREMTVALYEKLRGLQSFPSREALVSQIARDLETANFFLDGDRVRQSP